MLYYIFPILRYDKEYNFEYIFYYIIFYFVNLKYLKFETIISNDYEFACVFISPKSVSLENSLQISQNFTVCL